MQGELLPASLDAVVEALLRAVGERDSHPPFALVGYSSGGWLAHAMARRLECEGKSAAALILIDTYPSTDARFAAVLRTVMGEALRNDIYGFMGDDRLTAMGAYMRLLSGWQAEEIAAQTLLVRASEPMPGHAQEDQWRSSWELFDDAVDVPGSHFTMMEEDAGTTAEAIDAWLTNISADRDVEEVR